VAPSSSPPDSEALSSEEIKSGARTASNLAFSGGRRLVERRQADFLERSFCRGKSKYSEVEFNIYLYRLMITYSIAYIVFPLPPPLLLVHGSKQVPLLSLSPSPACFKVCLTGFCAKEIQ